jgi:NADH-quinone oxidoreductase subunit G
MAMITIHIDGVPYQVEQTDKNLLEVCLSLKLNLPYFCWHPALRSVGACRQCAVKLFKDANDQKGHLVMACMTPVVDGLRASINDPQAISFRAHIIEWLMMNHPHDCPVCDEGGECHLQDMTVMTGHAYRRYRFSKRTFRNQDLGPFVNHEMNRCIECYRCVRFYRNYAGGRDFNVFGWNKNLYFGRHEDGVLESPFSGNLVEVCPTGVFTDKTLKKHYTRKWDLSSAPSICPHCSLGCNTLPGAHEGIVRRSQNRYHPQINGYFLCDRGRYGYEYVNSEKRLFEPCVKGTNHKLEVASLQRALASIPRDGMVGIGSQRASLESNFALRELVGVENFYHTVSDATRTIIDIVQRNPEQTPTLHDAETSDAVFILGEDPTQTAPRLSLSLRQAVLQAPKARALSQRIPEWDDAAWREVIQEERGPLFIAACSPTLLDDIATESMCSSPSQIARLGFQVAHELDPIAPAPENLSDDLKQQSRRIADALRNAQHPLIVSGPFAHSIEVIQAAANIAQALPKARLLYTLPECNSFGLALLSGKSIESLLDTEIETLIILETDLYRYLDQDKVQALISKAKRVVILDHLITQTTTAADILLPVATMMEQEGTVINNEGRAQRFYKVLPSQKVFPSWHIFGELLNLHYGVNPWPHFDTLLHDLFQKLRLFAPLTDLAPPASFRMTGQKIPRESPRSSGRTALHANTSINEPKPPADEESPLSFSMEGTQNNPPAPLIPRFWAPGWNSVQAVNSFQATINGPYPEQGPGMRFLKQTGQTAYFDQIPPSFSSCETEWLLLPTFHLFGSEELSAYCPAICSLLPEPYLVVNCEQALSLGFKEGQKVSLSIPLGELALHLSHKVPKGIALVPWGLPHIRLIHKPALIAIHPV